MNSYERSGFDFSTEYGGTQIDPTIANESVAQAIAQANDNSAATAAAAVAVATAVKEASANRDHPESTGVLKRKRTNKPGAKFGARKRSWVWSWFQQDSHDHNKAVCLECGRTILRLSSDKGSPKKLVEHLKTHKIERDTECRHGGVGEAKDDSSEQLVRAIQLSSLKYDKSDLTRAVAVFAKEHGLSQEKVVQSESFAGLCRCLGVDVNDCF